MPVLRDLTGVERLEVLLGYRHSEYDSAGGVDAYKAELLYDPVQPLTLRSSYQHAVRAPSVFELYQPLLPTFYEASPDFGGVLDPCTAGSDERNGANSAQVDALCIAQGVPAALLPDYENSVGFFQGVYGGNPDLDPETADTLTIGLVLRSWSERLLWSSMQLSVDWYRIEVEEAIVQATALNYIPLCFDARVNPGFSADNELCRLFSRDPASGDIVDLLDIYQNIVGFEVSGIDLQFDWTFAAGPGDVGINWLASWMDYFESSMPKDCRRPMKSAASATSSAVRCRNGSRISTSATPGARYRWAAAGATSTACATASSMTTPYRATTTSTSLPVT